MELLWDKTMTAMGCLLQAQQGCESYYKSYFIGKTQTELVKFDIKESSAYIELSLPVNFPKGKFQGCLNSHLKMIELQQ